MNRRVLIFNYLLLLIAVFLLTGCSYVVDGFKISKLVTKKDTPDADVTYVVGDIRNIKGEDCERAYLTLELKQGRDVKTKILVINDNIRNGLVYNVYNPLQGDYINNKVTVKKVECFKKDATPKISEDGSSYDTSQIVTPGDDTDDPSGSGDSGDSGDYGDSSDWDDDWDDGMFE